MANRYTYQFPQQFKPKMAHVEGFVSIGTGGLLNTPLQFPTTASGVATGGFLQTGFLGMALMPGQATAGVPTGWQGGFSGALGLYGAGVQAIARIGTGTIAIQMSDDWVRCDSVQVEPYIGITGSPTGTASGTNLTAFGAAVTLNNIGLGNSQAVPTGSTGALIGGNLKNVLVLQFYNGIEKDLPSGGGFYISFRLRDSTAGAQ